MTIVSGIQPSGKLHVGNYLGAVKNWLALQTDSNNRCFFFIADWHSLTEQYDAAEKAAQVREVAAELLALGIDPKRVTFFRQSDIPEHLELAWYFACVTPVGEMERMTQYKDKITHGESSNVGLFIYPVLMAADVLAYASAVPNVNGKKLDGLGVPVGHDQKQHLELTNDIVRRFNKRFETVLPEVKLISTKEARVMSIKDPTRKMSKSLGGDHCLFLDDSPKEIERKVRAAVTETTTGSAGMSPGVRTIFELFEAFGDTDAVAGFRARYETGAIKYSEFKPAVAAAISNAFAEFRTRKTDLLADQKRIDDVLTAGAEAARAVARATLAAVRARIGIR